MKHLKFLREDDLFARSINITNNTRTYKCSSYYLKDKFYSIPYNETMHAQVTNDKFYFNSMGEKIIIVICEHCRTFFRVALLFNLSSKNNKRRGIPKKLHLSIEFDGNGMPQMIYRRNYHRIL